jgi:hypothetical protein
MKTFRDANRLKLLKNGSRHSASFLAFGGVLSEVSLKRGLIPKRSLNISGDGRRRDPFAE